MAKQVWTGVRLFSGGADLTTVNNKIELAADFDDKEVTAFDSTGAAWKEFLNGLASSTVDASGQWEALDTSKVDDEMWASIGAVSAVTIVPNSPVVAGDLTYFTQALRSSYHLGGAVGDVAPWEAKFAGSWPTVRGLIAHPPGTARTATGTGTSVTGVATSATTRLYASLHVLSVTGTSTPTITVKVQSDDNSGFTSATDRLTFTAATARGSQIARETSVGANTDTFYRAQWTISGSSPSFLFVVAFGVAV